MSYWPLGILLISVAFILVSIIKLKLHPFLALTFAAILTGLLTGDLPGMTHENVGLFKDRVELKETPDDTGNELLLAVKWSFLWVWKHRGWNRFYRRFGGHYWRLHAG